MEVLPTMELQEAISKPLRIYACTVAALFLLWNVLLILGGHRAGYFQTVLNLTVLLAINLKSPYSRFLLKVWCALPVISIGIYLLLSVMHRHWSQDPIDHVVGALLVLPVFIQLFRPAERPGDLQ